jgi:hypothetical protein
LTITTRTQRSRLARCELPRAPWPTRALTDTRQRRWGCLRARPPACPSVISVAASGSLEERKGHPGAFFEVQALRGRELLHVYALVEEARRVQRQLVYTTNCKFTHRHLQVSSAKRDNPWIQGTRNAAGLPFDTLLTDDGSLIARPGVGSFQSSVGTLWIKRNRVDSGAGAGTPEADGGGGGDASGADTDAPPTGDFREEEWAHEVFVPRRTLAGLLPDALLETYQFWKTGPLTLRGYAREPEHEHTLLVRLTTGAGQGVNSFGALVRRCKKTHKGQGSGGGDDGSAGMLLLNLLRTTPGTPLHCIADTLSRLDNLSHVLAWSSSDARLGEDLDITLVELPRLKLRFEARVHGGGGGGGGAEGAVVRLHSLDYDGLYIDDQPDEAVAALGGSIPHSIALASALGQKSLLVPNFALERVVIRSCPLNTELVLKASKFDKLEEQWAQDEWAQSVQTRFYIYPVHLSGTFLQTQSLASAFYLVLLFLMKREYEAAARLMSSCFTDTAFSTEEKWVMKLIRATAEDDKHPDAHAVRLRLALVCYECGEEVPWKVEDDLSGYITKYGHVSTVCRLSVEDEQLLLGHHGNPTRTQYLNAVTEAAVQPPAAEGGEPVTIDFDGAPCSVGGEAMQALLLHLGQRLGKRLAGDGGRGLLGRTQFKYERPHVSKTHGIAAVELLRDLEKDELSGRKKARGFCLLYEMLIGRLHVTISGGAQDAQELPVVEPDYDQSVARPSRDCPAGHTLTMNQNAGHSCDVCGERGTHFRCSQGCDYDMCQKCWLMRDPDVSPGDALRHMDTPPAGMRHRLPAAAICEPEESIGAQRRVPSNGVLVKMLVGAMLVKETDEFEKQSLHPDVAAGMALLLPLVHAATTGEPVMEKYPSLPVAQNRTKLQDGMPLEGQLETFFNLLSKRNAAWCETVGYKHALTPLPAPALYPSKLVIPPAFRLNCRPPASGCDCESRALTPLQLEGGADTESLCLSEEDAAAFAGVPLQKVLGLDEHLQTAPQLPAVQLSTMLQELPFDLSALPVAQSGVAQSMLRRMNEDLHASYATAKSGSVQRLRYLNDAHIEALRLDIAKAEQAAADGAAQEEEDEAEGASSSPTGSPRSPRDALLKSYSVASGLARTVSARGSTMLKVALQHLVRLRRSIVTARDREAACIGSGVLAAERMANETSHGPGVEEAERLAFELQRFAGQRLRLWFELIASAPLSSTAKQDLLRMNRCLAPQEIEPLLAATCGVLLRSVRLAQLNACLAAVDKLVGDIRLLVEQRVYADWLNDGVLKQPSIEMIQHALEGAGYDEKRGNVTLKALLATHERLLDWACQPVADGGGGLAALEELTEPAVDVCFQFCAYDEAATKRMLADEAAVRHIVDLALRGCHHQGRALMRPSLADKLRRASTALRSTAGQSLGGMVHLLQHSSHAVASHLSAARGYMDFNGSTARFDPRFLIFEYMVGFMLRRRQVELVNGFVQDARQGISRVEQMIMGQGKTTVIGPVLALMLGNGSSLVTLVCPAALLEMSRDVLRQAFSSVVTKRVYTLEFDRGSAASNDLEHFERLLKKLEVAKLEGSIVVTTPGAVKSLMLKYVDLLQQVQAAPRILRCPAASLGNQRDKALSMGAAMAENGLKADVLSRILALWGKEQKGVALLDEVDLLLHPLKSELNYPIGPKEPLESHDFRWDFPIFLLDALLYPATRKISLEDFRPSAHAVRILRELAARMEAGVQAMAVQPSPHLSLVRPEFYHEQLLEPMAEWAMLWLLGRPEVLALREACVEHARAQRPPTESGLAGLTPERVDELLLSYVSMRPAPRYSQAAEMLGWLLPEPAAGVAVAMKMLNLARDWVCNFLAHCFSKVSRPCPSWRRSILTEIYLCHACSCQELLRTETAAQVDRVSYGLLHGADYERWEAKEGQPVARPAPRHLLACPFVALEVPSRSSEFAHPEVLIGLTVLAYRYEGLRLEDLKKIVRALKKDMDAQAGPFAERAARVQFATWVEDANLARRRAHSQQAAAAAAEVAEEDIMELELFQPDDEAQLAALGRVLAKHGPTIIYHLQKMVFPKVMRN